jgi:hypothetical protein
LLSSTVKRVVLYRFDRLPLQGIVNPGSYLREDRVEFITLDGNLQTPVYTEIKAICFVSDAGRTDLFEDHSLFERRPKMAGLWTRFTFRDGDQLDGVLPQNLLDWPSAGYLLTPPHSGASRQRVFIPRTALSQTELLGVVGKATPANSAHRKPIDTGGVGQLTMFE